MGLLDFLGAQISGAKDKYEDAQSVSQDWDVNQLVDSLGRCSNIIQAAGYCETLKQKCEEMDDWELRDTFDRAWAAVGGRTTCKRKY